NSSKLGGAGNASRRSFVDTFTCGESEENLFLVLSFGAAEKVVQGNEDCALDARYSWWECGKVRRGRLWRSEERRSVFGCIGSAVWGPLCEFVCGGTPW